MTLRLLVFMSEGETAVDPWSCTTSQRMPLIVCTLCTLLYTQNWGRNWSHKCQALIPGFETYRSNMNTLNRQDTAWSKTLSKNDGKSKKVWPLRHVSRNSYWAQVGVFCMQMGPPRPFLPTSWQVPGCFQVYVKVGVVATNPSFKSAGITTHRCRSFTL